MTVQIRPDLVLPEVLHILPARHGDARGWFSEVYAERDYFAAGLTTRFVQDNHSSSRAPATLRGLHFQTPPNSQAKLVRCVRGRVFDVVVDIRQGSPRFGQHTSAVLSAELGESLFVPEGFAHGFCTLEADCEVTYKVSAPYARESDAGLAFDDPDLGIAWPFPAERLVMSDRDRAHPRLRHLAPHFDLAIKGAGP